MVDRDTFDQFLNIIGLKPKHMLKENGKRDKPYDYKNDLLIDTEKSIYEIK